MELLSAYIRNKIAVGDTESDKLLIFDLDDTIINTTARVKVRKNGIYIKTLTNNEYNTYRLHPGESFDFDEFNDKQILFKESFTKYWDTLRREYSKGTHICILTAREDADAVRDFFLYHGIDISHRLIFAVGGTQPGPHKSIQQRKADVIKLLAGRGYHTMVFFDDNDGNLTAARRLSSKICVKIHTVKV